MPIKAESEANLIGSAEPNLQKAVSSHRPQRNSALDFTKGALVLLMVLYQLDQLFHRTSMGVLRIPPVSDTVIHFHYRIPDLQRLLVEIRPDRSAPFEEAFAQADYLAIFLALNVSRTFIVPVLGTGVLVQNALDPSNIFTIFVSGNLPIVGGKFTLFRSSCLSATCSWFRQCL